MKNYLKSEIYRFRKSNTFLNYFKVMGVLILIFDLILFLGNKGFLSFKINKPESIAQVSVQSMIFTFGIFIAYVLVDRIVNEPIGDGVLKNSFSIGLSRNVKYFSDFLNSVIVVTLFTIASILLHFTICGILFGFNTVFSVEGIGYTKNFLSGFGNAMITLISYISLCLMFSYAIKFEFVARIIPIFAITLYPLLLNGAMRFIDNKALSFLKEIDIMSNINAFNNIYEYYSFDFKNAIIAASVIIITTIIGVLVFNKREV